MSTDRDVTRIVRSWLDEGATQLPDRVLDAVLDQIPATPQRRSSFWAAWRFLPMNTTFRLGVAAAILVVAGVLGFKYLAGPNIGGPPSTSQTEPTPSLVAIAEGETLSAGAHTISVSGPYGSFEIDLSLPAGWVASHISSGEVSLVGANGSAPYLGFFSVQRVYNNPCHLANGLAGGYIGVSNSQDVVDELRSLEGFEAGPISLLRIGGLPTTHFVLSNDIDTETASCTAGDLLPLFMTGEATDRQLEVSTRLHSPATNGGTTQQIWVVDRRLIPLLIIAELGADDPEGDLATVEQILTSIGLN